MSTFIVTAENPAHQKALKAFLKALEIPFKKAKTEEPPCDPAFVTKIEESRAEFAAGEGTRMTMQEVLALCK